MIRGTRNTAHSIDAVRTTDDGDVIRLYKDNNIAGVLGTQKWGIGNSNPQNKLDITATTWDDGLLIKNTGNFNVGIIADANRSGAGGGILNLASKWNGTEVAGILFQTGSDTTNKDDGEIVFRTASAGTPTQRAKITNSGNLLIGKSSSSPFGTSGHEINGDGEMFITKSGTPFNVNRNGSTGRIINILKDGTSIGEIGAKSNSNIYIDSKGSNQSGIEFDGDTIVPRRNGAVADNEVNLGYSGTKFKNITLGGGIYLGGTGTANKLDDYEEGTWTGSVNGSSNTNTGVYTKIGNKVYVSIFLRGLNVTSAVSARITGLPFTATNDSNYYTTGSITYNTYASNCDGGNGYFVTNNTYFQMVRVDSTNDATSDIAGNQEIMLAGFYTTDA